MTTTSPSATIRADGCRPTPGFKPERGRAMSTTDEALRDNRDLWDAWTRIHVGSSFYDVASFRTGERAVRLADYEIGENFRA